MLSLENKIFNSINKYNQICLCYSGGVDSTLLLYLLSQVKPVVAITVNGDMVSSEDFRSAEEFIEELENVQHEIIPVDILKLNEFRENGPERCYFCKKFILGEVVKRAKELGCDVVVDGSNIDDLGDYRPGLKAINELGIVSPFIEVGITKSDIYDLSAKYNLPTKDRPAGACLATRIPTGETITKESLEKVSKAEVFLKKFGFKQLRLRLKNNQFGTLECYKEDFDKFYDNKKIINKELNDLGIILDSKPKEYKTGNMNKGVEI